MTRLVAPSRALVLTLALLLACTLTSRASDSAATPVDNASQTLFNGKNLDGWTVTEFAGHGEPRVEDGAIILPMGESLTGVNFTGKTPKMNYEVELDAKRVDGNDFFVGLTFPYADSHASLILGGWGGGVCGISSLDGEDAARNETTKVKKFEKGQWYHVKLRVVPNSIQAWVDDELLIDVSTRGKKVDIRREVGPSRPFGLASFQTIAAVKNIKLTPVPNDK